MDIKKKNNNINFHINLKYLYYYYINYFINVIKTDLLSVFELFFI